MVAKISHRMLGVNRCHFSLAGSGGATDTQRKVFKHLFALGSFILHFFFFFHLLMKKAYSWKATGLTCPSRWRSLATVCTAGRQRGKQPQNAGPGRGPLRGRNVPSPTQPGPRPCLQQLHLTQRRCLSWAAPYCLPPQEDGVVIKMEPMLQLLHHRLTFTLGAI